MSELTERPAWVEVSMPRADSHGAIDRLVQEGVGVWCRHSSLQAGTHDVVHLHTSYGSVRRLLRTWTNTSCPRRKWCVRGDWGAKGAARVRPVWVPTHAAPRLRRNKPFR